jgi:hypothetical protein
VNGDIVARDFYSNNGQFFGSATGTRNIILGGNGTRATTTLNTGTDNFFVGLNAGRVNTTGSDNIFSGNSAGFNNTTGFSNIFSGSGAGFSNTIGYGNIFSGSDAGWSNTTGSDNIFFGGSAGNQNTTGSNNIFSGQAAGYFNTTGFNNIFSGFNAGRNNTTGSNNIFSGNSAGLLNTTGSASVALGWSALYNQTGAGASSTALGAFAGFTNTTGTRNLFLGDEADALSGTLTNATAIGSNARVGASNSLVLGGTGAFAVNVGIGTTSPFARLSVGMDATNPALLIGNTGSSTPSLFVAGANQNGFVGFGTTTTNTLGRIVIDNTISSLLGAGQAVAGIYQYYKFNPTAGGTQVGDRMIVENNPTSATNTAVAKIIRTIDNSSLSNLVRGLEVVASAGSNSFGVNTGIRSVGHTFGIQALTTGNAGGTSTPAAIYGESTGTTQGDILRLYTTTMTTATSVASFYQETSAFSGTGLTMNFGKGGGSFTGNFLDFQVNDNTRFVVTAGGTTTIGQLNQTTTQAGLQIGNGGLCVDNDGACVASTSGRITAREFNTSGADIAEEYYSSEALQPGDIVSTKGKFEIGKAQSSADAIMGVVSTKPGIVLGKGEVKFSSLNEYPVGLQGRVPVRLSTENGPIAIGDKIALSGIAGVGMKFDPSKGGTIIGIALEAFDGARALSEGTVEVKTQRVATGTPVCTTVPVFGDAKAFGGLDSDGAGVAPVAGVGFDTQCTQAYVEVVPEAGTGIEENTNAGMSVKIGSALVFLGIQRGTLTVSGGVMPVADTDLSLNNNSILNVKSIASMNGTWSISEDGLLVVDTVKARNVFVGENLEVGTPERATGITIYDTVTGQPFCMQIANGAMASIAGVCGSATNGAGDAGAGNTDPETPDPVTPEDTGGNAPSAPPVGGAGETGSSTPPEITPPIPPDDSSGGTVTTQDPETPPVSVSEGDSNSGTNI